MDEEPGHGDTPFKPKMLTCHFSHKEHDAPEPLFRDDHNVKVKQCLRHRITNHMYRHWQAWSSGKGWENAEGLSKEMALKVFKQHESLYLQRWKVSTLTHHGSVDCLTDEENEAIQAVIDGNRPSVYQLERGMALRSNRDAAPSSTGPKDADLLLYSIQQQSSNKTKQPLPDTANFSKRKRGSSETSRTNPKNVKEQSDANIHCGAIDVDSLEMKHDSSPMSSDPTLTSDSPSSSARVESVRASRSPLDPQADEWIEDDSSEDEQARSSTRTGSERRRKFSRRPRLASTPPPVHERHRSLRRTNSGFTPINQDRSESPPHCIRSHMPDINHRAAPRTETAQHITTSTFTAVVDAIVTMANEKGAEQAHSYLKNMVNLFDGTKNEEYMEEVARTIKQTMAVGRGEGFKAETSSTPHPEPDQARPPIMVRSTVAVAFTEAFLDLARGSAGLGRAKGQLHIAGFWTLVKDDAYVEGLTGILRDVAKFHR